MNSRKLIATLLIVFTCQIAVLGTRFYIYASSASALMVQVDSENKSKGSPKASLKIIEHFNFDCPACKRASIAIQRYQSLYPNSIYLEHHFHPFERRIHGILSSVYAECAARQNKYWDFHDSLFASQDQWRMKEDPAEFFDTTAEVLGLDMDELSACVADPDVKAGIISARNAASGNGIKATPTFFVNGEMLVGANAMIRRLGAEFPEVNVQDESD